jgi:hypothetical protein
LLAISVNLLGGLLATAHAQQKKTYLDCSVVTRYYGAPFNGSQFDDRFTLEIIQDGKSMSITTDSDKSGSHIRFATADIVGFSIGSARIHNAMNYSSESEISVAWDVVQRTGELFASYTLKLSRYSGALKFDERKFFSTSGNCGVMKDRKF